MRWIRPEHHKRTKDAIYQSLFSENSSNASGLYYILLGFFRYIETMTEKRQEYSALKMYSGEGNLKCLETGMCQTVTVPWAGLKQLVFFYNFFSLTGFLLSKSFLRSATHEKCLEVYLLIEMFWKNTVNC